MKPARLTVVTANIGRGVKTPEAAVNIRRVVDGYRPTWWRPNPAAIGWQEIDEADFPNEHGLLHETVRKLSPGALIVGFKTAVPIVIPSGWDVITERVNLTCQGRAGVTPQRVAVQALIEHHDTGTRVVLVNGHYPHNAPDLWRVCQNAWERVVESWTDRGYTVVTTRDRNKPGITDPLSPWEVPQLDPRLLDKITVIQAHGPRAVRVTAGKPRTVKLSIDGHDAHGVPMTFTPYVPR